jgi:hypothetical protein
MSNKVWNVWLPGLRRPWRTRKPRTLIGRLLKSIFVLIVWLICLAWAVCVVLPLNLTWIMFRAIRILIP